MRRGWIVLLCAPVLFAVEDPISRMMNPQQSVAQRADACFELRGNRAPEALAAMRRMLADAAVRACAARNLREAGAAGELRNAMDATDPDVRAAAARELGALKDLEALPLLARAAADANVMVATNAVRGLSQYQDHAVLPYLLDLAKKGGIIGVPALERAAEFRDTRALVIARGYLDSRDVASSAVALQVIGDLGDSSDLTRLREIAARREKLTARGRGFGLLPVIDLGRAAENAIAAIAARGVPASH